MSTRRKFMLTLGGLAAASLFPASRTFGKPRVARRQFADVPLKATRLRDNVYAITEGGGNSLQVITADGTILIDTKIATVADELRAKTIEVGHGAGKGGDPPRLVINTHHHADHTGGNYVFSPGETTEIIAHRKLKPRLDDAIESRMRPALLEKARRLRGEPGMEPLAEKLVERARTLSAADFAPDQEFDDKHGFEHGEVEIILNHFGPGHTDNDTVIFFPTLNVIHMGDLFFHNLHPFIDRPAGATTVGWKNSVRKAMELCDNKTIVIPGHGEVTSKSSLPRQIEYFDKLQAVVERAISEGKSKETIAAMKPEEFKGYGFEQILPVALGAMYDEISEGIH